MEFQKNQNQNQKPVGRLDVQIILESGQRKLNMNIYICLFFIEKF